MNIEKEIKNINKVNFLTSGAFLLLGLSTMNNFLPVSNSIQIAGTFMTVGSIPFLIGEWLFKRDLKNKLTLSSSFLKFRYEKVLTEKLNYILKVENPIEKKYELFCFLIYMNYHKVKDLDLPYKMISKIEKIIDDLKKNNMVPTNFNFHIDLNGSIFKCILEDSSDIEKMKIAKEIFKSYDSIGMLGKNIYKPLTPLVQSLFLLQDELKEADYKEISKYNKIKAKGSRFENMSKFNTPLMLYADIFKDLLIKLFEKEKSTKNKEIILEFFKDHSIGDELIVVNNKNNLDKVLSEKPKSISTSKRKI